MITGQGCSNTELNNDSFQREEPNLEKRIKKKTNEKKRKIRNENLKKINEMKTNEERHI